MKKELFFLSAILLIISGCTMKQQTPESVLEAKIKRFAPTEITGDITKLSSGDKAALVKLIEAAHMMDSIYIRQVWSGNDSFLHQLEADRSQLGKLRLQYFKINMSPWSGLDHDSAFIPGAPPKPDGANYYPPDMTKDDFNSWLATLPPDEKKDATGFFYVIRLGPEGKLMPVSYATEYRTLLEQAAQLLREAAALTTNESLRNFLNLRADAFLSNDYYSSDVAWMELDSPIDVTIGPYEVYMDRLFNYKAAFEAFITLRDEEETAKLAKFSSYLQEVENNLPIDPKYRNPKLGAMSPIRVVDEVCTGGEARAGVQTAAFNLPNDERVTREKGTKRVMLKNVQEAKFHTILLPIANIAIDPSQRKMVSFEPFFTHILAHELMHGLGPHTIIVNGKRTTVRQEMKELGSALEEAKADISGLWMLQFLMDKGVIEKSFEQQMYVTYLAGVFRSVRFGTNEAHGKGMAMQFNFLTDDGAFEYDPASQTFKVNFEKIKDAVRKLTSEIMTIQAQGDYAKAKALLGQYGVIRPPMQNILNKLTDVPVDIAPKFPLAGNY
ncbi:MAG: hypothetical protein KGJ59_01480 [Bacteroidota bacterium]|nr:hypothetical protein [Bacteroidota bacterium]